MDKFRGKVAVVTGASSGIGAATARRLVDEGMIVAGIDRRGEKLQDLAQQLPTGQFHPFKCDITSDAEIVQTFVDIERQLGSIHVLVNNAGVAHWIPLFDAQADALRSLFATNCIGQCLCTREALRNMKKYGVDEGGYILFTNSLGAHVIQSSPSEKPVPIYPYTASKHALKAIVEGLRQELRAQGSKIRVGQVCPAAVDTNIAHSFQHNHQQSEEVQAQSMDVFRHVMSNIDLLQPEDVAAAFVFMLSMPTRADVNDVIINHKAK